MISTNLLIQCMIFSLIFITLDVVNAMHAVGGWSTISVDNALLTESLNKVKSNLQTQQNSNVHLRYLRVLSAQSQVVAGSKYKVKVEIGLTDCPITSPVNDYCRTFKKQNCSIEMWVQSWLNRYEILNYNCSKIEFAPLEFSSRPMPGGISKADITNDHIVQAAIVGKNILESSMNGLFHLSTYTIVEATQQAVFGMMYRLLVDFKVVSPTNSITPVVNRCYLAVLFPPSSTQQPTLHKHDCEGPYIPA